MNPPSLPTNSPAINVAQSQEAPALANPPATYSVSRQTGVVSVFATERLLRQVKKFLDTIHRSTTTQVLIEAKVLEVALTDEFASGIDWSSVNAAVRANFSSPGFTPTATSIFTAKLGIGEGTHPIISALSRFGTVRALSSPRVTVMNNQPAVVNVSENKVYFTIQVTSIPQTGVSPGPPTVTYNTTQQSVPEGVLLNVIPTANAETGEIILAVRPTVTKEVTTVDDPVIKLTNPTLDVTSKIPQMSVQEMDSIVKMQSGQTVVMGGLMKDENVVSEEGVPIIGSIPLIGTLFHNHGDRIQKTELVIFLTSTIIPGANVDDMDRKIYDGFGQDRRPVKL
jgi:general secretion pathway protein D